MLYKLISLIEICFVIFLKDMKIFEEFENEFNCYFYFIYYKLGLKGIYYFIGVFWYVFFLNNNEIKYFLILKFFVGNFLMKLKDVECFLDSFMIKFVVGIFVN